MVIDMDTVIISGKRYNEMDVVREKEEYVRLEAVDLCFALTRLIQDASPVVRAAVARKRVGHETLVADESWRVRATVAKYTNNEKYLEILANDINEFVRFIVVKKGCCLESLKNDMDEEIAAIARNLLQNLELA